MCGCYILDDFFLFYDEKITMYIYKLAQTHTHIINMYLHLNISNGLVSFP